ncbi:Gfo/Idh/MocA family oxidoreductase [Lacipirellula sp.]|uniref:Gfo/Idh/MocA family protein n=1 Tax=Lacipirellula sp. TaxID=2691419 RepID=UPI003D14F36B
MSADRSPAREGKSAVRFTRRDALRIGAAAMVAGPFLRTGRSFAAGPEQKARIASIGVGNKGWTDLLAVASAPGAEIVAICDIDSNFLGVAQEKFPQAQAFRDYRVLLDKMGNGIDGVLISTPDHMHGAIALAAMALGKHVYVQKPLAHNLAELRAMCNAAAEQGVITQMGTQIHGDESYRTAAKMLRDGAIGKVSEVHCWIGRGLPLPAKERPANRADKIPATVDWDLWQGVAPEEPYVEGFYHPFNWRMWRDYGGGVLGDMASHIFDPIFTGIDLKAPLTLRSGGPAHLRDTYATNTEVLYTFAGTPLTAGEVKFRWTNGTFKPDAAKAQLPDGVNLSASGSFTVGEKGVMVLPHWGMPTFYSNGKPMDLEIKSEGNVDHYHEWVAAIRGEGQTSTPFTFSGPLTEAVIAGTVAGAFPEETLAWDSAALKFDHDGANALVHRKYRDDWRPLGV